MGIRGGHFYPPIPFQIEMIGFCQSQIWNCWLDSANFDILYGARYNLISRVKSAIILLFRPTINNNTLAPGLPG